MTLTYTNKIFLAGRHRQVNTHKSEEVQCLVDPRVEFHSTANPGLSDVVTSSRKKKVIMIIKTKVQDFGRCKADRFLHFRVGMILPELT